MKQYNVIKTSKPDWETIPKAYIESYPWGREYTPVSYGQVAFIEGVGFAVCLSCEEKNPKAVYFNYGDPVHTDSCLEFFPAFNNNSPYYVNFEANANGAFVCCRRTCRADKMPLDKLIDINRIKVTAGRKENLWYVEYVIPLDVIEAVYGVKDFPVGYKFKGNFYKCGDETAIPHFGSYFPIEWEKPDFHRPEFFGDFVITE